VLTLEREAWVRSDVRFAVVDRAIEELQLNLPPEAKDPLYIVGPGIKEVVAARRPASGWCASISPGKACACCASNTARRSKPTRTCPCPTSACSGNFDSRRRVVFPEPEWSS